MESLDLLTLQMGMRQVGGRHVERKVPGKEEGEVMSWYFWEVCRQRFLGDWWPDSISHLLGLHTYIVPALPYLPPCSAVFLLAGLVSSVLSMITAGGYMVGKDVIWKVCFQKEHAYCIFLLNFCFSRSNVTYFKQYSRLASEYQCTLDINNVVVLPFVN